MFDLDPHVRANVVRWEGEAGRRWIEALPGTVAELAERWQLSDFGPALPGGSHSYVVTVRAPSGDGVLKVPLVGDENRFEAAALSLYDGDGAVRLLAHDGPSGALLLERCRPGTQLGDHADRQAATRTACALLRRLWREPGAGHEFLLTATKAAEWAATFERHAARHDRDAPLLPLLQAGARLARDLAGVSGRSVLVNRDAHLGNFLAAQREPWLLIDPKPLVGDPAFDAGYLVADLAGALPGPRIVAAIVDQLAGELGVDRDHVRAWALVRAVENILWAQELGEDSAAETALATALCSEA